jgi:hypothetical protein
VITELLPQRLLSLGLVEQGVRHPGVTQPLLWLRDSDIRRGRRGAGRRRLGDVRRCDITRLSERTTSTSVVRSRAGPDRPLD